MTTDPALPDAAGGLSTDARPPDPQQDAGAGTKSPPDEDPKSQPKDEASASDARGQAKAKPLFSETARTAGGGASISQKPFSPARGADEYVPRAEDLAEFDRRVAKDRLVIVRSASRSVLNGLLHHARETLATALELNVPAGMGAQELLYYLKGPAAARQRSGVTFVVMVDREAANDRRWACPETTLATMRLELARFDDRMVILVPRLADGEFEPAATLAVDYVEPIVRRLRAKGDVRAEARVQASAEAVRKVLHDIRQNAEHPETIDDDAEQVLESLPCAASDDDWIGQLRSKLIDPATDVEKGIRTLLGNRVEPDATVLYVAACLGGLNLRDFERAVSALLSEEYQDAALEVPAPAPAVAQSDNTAAAAAPVGPSRIRRIWLAAEFEAASDIKREKAHLKLDTWGVSDSSGTSAGTAESESGRGPGAPAEIAYETPGLLKKVQSILRSDRAGYSLARLRKVVFVGLAEDSSEKLARAARQAIGALLSQMSTEESAGWLARVAWRHFLVSAGDEGVLPARSRPVMQLVDQGLVDPAADRQRRRFDAMYQYMLPRDIIGEALGHLPSKWRQIELEAGDEALRSLTAALEIAKLLIGNAKGGAMVDALIDAAVDKGLVFGPAFIAANLSREREGGRYGVRLVDLIAKVPDGIRHSIREFIQKEGEEDRAGAAQMCEALIARLPDGSVSDGDDSERRELPYEHIRLLAAATDAVRPEDYGASNRRTMLVDAYLPSDTAADYATAARAVTHASLNEYVTALATRQDPHSYRSDAWRLERLLDLKTRMMRWVLRPLGPVDDWDRLSRKLFDQFELWFDKNNEHGHLELSAAKEEHEKHVEAVVQEGEAVASLLRPLDDFDDRVFELVHSKKIEVVRREGDRQVRRIVEKHMQVAKLLPVLAAFEWWLLLRGGGAGDTPASTSFASALAAAADPSWRQMTVTCELAARDLLDEVTPWVEALDLERSQRRQLLEGYRAKRRLTTTFARLVRGIPSRLPSA